MTSDMPVEIEAGVTPVGEGGMLALPFVVGTGGVGGGGQARLSDIWCEEAVHIILQQCVDVEVHRCFHGTIEQGHLLQVEMLGVEFGLRGNGQRECGDDRCEEVSSFHNRCGMGWLLRLEGLGFVIVCQSRSKYTHLY